MEISDHAIAQFLRRVGGITKVESRITQALKFGVEVLPRDTLRATLANKTKPTKYYMKGAFVAVVREDTVVTILEYNKREWIRESAIKQSKN